jgi:hypothetical protein
MSRRHFPSPLRRSLVLLSVAALFAGVSIRVVLAATFVGLDDDPTYVEDGPAVILDDDAVITGAAKYDGATLTLARHGGASPDDVFGDSGTLEFSDGVVYLKEFVNGTNVSIPVGAFTNIDGTLIITFNANATQARVDAVLEQIDYGNSSNNPPPSVTIDFTFNDGVAPSAGSVTVSITPSNDAPVNSLPVPQTVNEDTSLTFSAANGNPISVSDADAGNAEVKVTLTAAYGTFSLGGTSGLTFTPAGADNDGTNDTQMVFTGTIPAVNAALNGLVFTPTPNFSSPPPATLTILTDDQGNTGTDGAKSTSDTILINVLSDNANDGGPSAGAVVISEFRLRGPVPASPALDNQQGQLDEFIELYNNTDSDIVVADVSPLGLASDGWAVYSSDNLEQPKYVVPAGTRIPARGHFLITNSKGYSLSAYAAADTVLDPSATPVPASYSANIPDGAALALFRTGTPDPSSPNDRLDLVGFAQSGFSEDTPLQPAGGVTTASQHSFVRRLSSGRPQDTDNNAADFQFVSTDAGNYGGAQSTLGAPGPQNSESPVQRNQLIKASLIDPKQPAGAPPNSVRKTCADEGVEECNASRSAQGTFSIRRRWTNTTGEDVTRLRFRIVDVTTLNSPGYAAGGSQADLRAISSGQVTGVMVTSVAALDGVTVEGTTLEAPSSATLGGGLNSTLAAGTVSVADRLVPGESINLQFLLGVQQPGAYRFFVNVEAVSQAPPAGNVSAKAGASGPKALKSKSER